MFIYIEVIGRIRLFWESKSIRITYPLLIAITALSRYIILQENSEPLTLIYESSAILLIAIAILLLRMRKSKILGIDKVKEGEDS